MNIYLDIDGVLIKKDGQPTEFVTEFLRYITNNHEVYWLTTHCRDDVSVPIAYLSDKLPGEALQYLKKIKASNWKTLKTEAIDLSKDFKWFDDNILLSEKKVLLEANKLGSFFLVSPDRSFSDFVDDKDVQWMFQKAGDSWTKMEFKLELNEQEYNKVSGGSLSNKGQDERWEFIFIDQTLYILRKGSNWVAYKVKFNKIRDTYCAVETYTAHAGTEKKSSASQQWWNNYHSRNIFALIEHYFFGNNLNYLYSNEVDNILKVNINGLHGFNHWRRVNQFGQKIAKFNGADLEIIRHFAFLHDIARQNDFTDPEHGLRAAEYINDHRTEFKLSGKQINKLIEAVKYHSDGYYRSNDVTIMTCLDADRLDLPRVGTKVDLTYLQTEAAKKNINNF